MIESNNVTKTKYVDEKAIGEKHIACLTDVDTNYLLIGKENNPKAMLAHLEIKDK